MTRGKEDKSRQASWTVKLYDIVISLEAECVAGCVWSSAQQSAPRQDDLMKLLSKLMVRYWPSLTSSGWTSTWPWKRTSLASQHSPDSNKKLFSPHFKQVFLRSSPEEELTQQQTDTLPVFDHVYPVTSLHPPTTEASTARESYSINSIVIVWLVGVFYFKNVLRKKMM